MKNYISNTLDTLKGVELMVPHYSVEDIEAITIELNIMRSKLDGKNTPELIPVYDALARTSMALLERMTEHARDIEDSYTP
jgi:hypothetical protein